MEWNIEEKDLDDIIVVWVKKVAFVVVIILFGMCSYVKV